MNYLKRSDVDKLLELNPDDKTIYVFRGGLFGADWRIDKVEEFADKMRFSGSVARSMKHGLAALDGNEWLFFATNENFHDFYEKHKDVY